MLAFTPGLELCRRFYEEAVCPLLVQHFPDLPYAAALIGPGSDVLGFDTEMSMDHFWGPRLQIFLRDQDIPFASRIDEMLRNSLPHIFEGFPVDVVEVPDEPGVTLMHLTHEGQVNHHVTFLTLQDFLQSRLAYDINQPLEAADWLTFPAQTLREITAGAVYHDGVGELTALRTRLAWYPHDVWLYLLASGWQRIGQEEHLMPRAGYVGDELGSAIIGSRLVRDIMYLCFLMEKHYAPYPKWFGSAFKQLQCAQNLWPILWRAQQSSIWQEREAALCEAYSFLAHMHNALGITRKLPETVSPFYARPFKVIRSDVFVQALLEQITDSSIKHLTKRRLIGNIDQFSDSTDLRDASWRLVLRKLYE